ncbi:hypothetical protein DEU56DRAFT_841466 [Suillus clintonianus]|uniref:uncharacterized protein n=1 Tax=Suillus clintonianus TaxID=1904413 RepID=UPI001B866C59|nr:uncharacterized protein DEU56DRAFT_841466 [Suillus clintonianus]KAG2115003.1 hypothetical protein DEU56DRAFT_841466 [Suillus clintonianus]
MAAKRKNSDTIDPTTSSALSALLPAPSTSRNRVPRSATSSRSSSRPSRSQSGGPSEDTSLLPDHAEGDLSHHRRKRPRIDTSDEEQTDVDQFHEARLPSNPPENNVSDDFSEAGTSSQVASTSLLSSWNMAPNLMLGSIPSLDEELELADSDQPPPTQESVASQAHPDATDAEIEIYIVEQRGTSLSVSEITDVLSDDVVVISPTLSPRRTLPSLRPIVIDDPIPVEVMGAFTPEAATSQNPHVSPLNATNSSSSAPEPLSAYTCPICFSPPTNATLTPCGHICCGACLFAAVKSTVKRNMVIAMDRAPVPRCPVCRAEIPGWDGRGGGVVGLKVEVVYSL